MSTPTPTSTLDQILAVQLTVAWAGEGRCEPRRLGWWQTDLVDAAGGEPPSNALPIPIDFAKPFTAERFAEAIRAPGGEERRGRERPGGNVRK